MDTYQEFGLALSAIPFTNSIKLDSSNFSGEVKKLKLERGFYIYSWDIALKKDFAFIHNHGSGAEHYHMIAYFFEPSFTRIDLSFSKSGKKQSFSAQKPSFMYIDSDAKAEFFYRKESKVKCMTLVFQQGWIDDQMTLVGDDVGGTVRQNGRLVKHSFGELSPVQAVISEQLFLDFKANQPRLAIKSYVYKLFRQFITFENKSTLLSTGTDELMDEVRDSIISCLTTSLPSLEQLAHKFLLSESSLKRHFKNVFGQTIYEYYLSQKMHLARKMIVEQNLNVSQAANELGYESISHFSALFTRYFGTHPGECKKNSPGQHNIFTEASS